MSKRVRPLVRTLWKDRLEDEHGNVLFESEHRNLITDDGLDAMISRLFDPDTTQPLMTYVAIGSDGTTPASDDAALGTELARVEVDFTAGGTGVCTLTAVFGAGVGTGTVRERGLFDASSSGTLIARSLREAFTKEAATVYTVVVLITLAEDV